MVQEDTLRTTSCNCVNWITSQRRFLCSALPPSIPPTGSWGEVIVSIALLAMIATMVLSYFEYKKVAESARTGA